MTLFPDIQSRAQAEIDAVVGYDRLPTSADRSSLPYIDALVKEVFRWNPVAPTGTCPNVALLRLDFRPKRANFARASSPCP